MTATPLTHRLWLPDEAATTAFGARLAAAFGLAPTGVVTLSGGLGAGKTHLVRAWLRALGVRGAVRSPTYTLVEPYEIGPARVFHLDLYRLQSPQEWDGLGLDDHPPTRHLWLIEWPCRGEGFVPPARLQIGLENEGGGRRVQLVWASPADPAAQIISEDLKNIR